MTIEKVLVVDHDLIHLSLLQKEIRKRRCEVYIAESGPTALDLLKRHTFDLILCDFHIPKTGGLEILKIAKHQSPSPLVILTTAIDCLDTATQAMQLGAFNVLLKPFSKETLDALLDKAGEHIDLRQENSYLRDEISTRQNHKKHALIAHSPVMKQILSDVEKIAQSSASVFISGESGTGKEMIAGAIHALSPRVFQPFIKVNCAAIPTNLLESEFFGHEKGAFTGAIQKKLGRFELADKGTLLLDEVSEIPLELQAKLLRAVQELEFERVGGVRPLSVDIRFVSTSNRTMKDAIEQKLFREDLYYRLNVVPIHLPPLRERKEDILPLAEFFLERLCEENQKPLKRLTPDACEKLIHYTWPGNIRELANVIERTVVMNPSEILAAHQIYIDLACSIQDAPTPNLPANITLAELEKRHILDTLSRHNQNRTRTAQTLGISIRTLRNKLHQYSSAP